MISEFSLPMKDYRFKKIANLLSTIRKLYHKEIIHKHVDFSLTNVTFQVIE